jgi:mannosyltransferase
MIETFSASRDSRSPRAGGQGRAFQVEGMTLLPILVLAFALRIAGLGSGSLWYDETVSVHLAGKALAALVAHTARDIHPPGYYLLLHPWLRLAGESEFAAAFLSLFFGLLLVALAYRLGRSVSGPQAGLWAALLVALSPYNLWYSQEVRMYTLGAALGVGLLLATLSLLRWSRGPVPWGRLALYALLGAAALWTLYYSAFLLVALNLLVAALWLGGLQPGRRQPAGRRWLAAWALAQVGALLLYAPWLPVAWRQASQPPVPPWRGFTGLGQVLIETWSALSLGQSADLAWAWPAAILFALLVTLGLAGRRARGQAWFLLGSVLLPVLLIYLASFAAPLYHVRYAFTYSTAFYVVAGAGLAFLWRWRRPVAWLSLALAAVLALASIYAYHTDPHYAPDDHRAAVRFLADAWRPGDVVVVDAGYAYTALLTYWPGEPFARVARLVGGPGTGGGDADVPLVLLAGSVDGSPSLGWGDPQSDFYAMSADETAAALKQLVAGYDRLWLYRIYDTVTDPGGFIRSWLQAHGQPFEDRVFAGEANLRVQGYLTGRDPLTGLEEQDGAYLTGGSLALAGSTPLPAKVEVGGALDLALAWRVGRAPPADALLFAGLFDPAGGRWAQVDERPAGTLYPSSAWPPGSLARTPLRLPIPAGTPPGSYAVEVGWYRFQDGQPVWLPWSLGDRLVLGQVQVVAPSAGWASLPSPEVSHRAGVSLGHGVRLLGFDAPRLEGRPGDELPLVLYWQAEEDQPQPGSPVLQLARDGGQVVAEQVATLAGGRATFGHLEAGQVVRDPQTLVLPAGLEPGVYNLRLGRRGPDGSWLPVRRGPVPLGQGYPLATVHVLGRELDRVAPTPARPAEVRFGEGILLVGFDLQPADPGPSPAALDLTVYWEALAPMADRFKVFVHLVGAGGPADLHAQADAYPHFPTNGWVPGEYLEDRVHLDLPAGLPPGDYRLLVGFYDEGGGARLPVHSAGGALLGDSYELISLTVGE